MLDYFVLVVGVLNLIRALILFNESREHKIQLFLSIMIVTGYIRLIMIGN